MTRKIHLCLVMGTTMVRHDGGANQNDLLKILYPRDQLRNKRVGQVILN